MKFEETARRLRAALDENNMKPQELSERSGVSKSSISQYVNGSHKPSNISAGKMGAVLGVSPMWLMGFDFPKAPKEKTTIVHTDGQPGWYLDPETAKAAQELLENPDTRMLFDAARDAKPENIRFAAEMLKRFKETNPDG